jgi:hypothetical protein
VDLTGIIPYNDALAIPLSLGISATAGVVNTGSRARRGFALLIATLTLVPPFMVSTDFRMLRFVTSLGVVLALFRSLDLYFDDRPWSAARRAWLMVAIFDTRDVSFEEPGFDKRSWLRFVAFAPPTVLGFWYSLTIDTSAGELSPLLLRWLAGTIGLYCSVEVAVGMIRGGYALGGIIVPPVHVDPILSRSVSEFWGRRWNLVVHEMLATHCFRPLARRGHPVLGVLAAFLGSAVVHFWLIFVPLGVLYATTMAAFFVLQGVLMLVERPLRVRRWRRPFAHTWTVVCVLGTSPLFTEPMLQVFPT